MILDHAGGKGAAGVGTGVHAFLVDASSVLGTLGVQDALGTTHGRRTTVLG